MQKIYINAEYSDDQADDMILHLAKNGFSVTAAKAEGHWSINAFKDQRKDLAATMEDIERRFSTVDGGIHTCSSGDEGAVDIAAMNFNVNPGKDSVGV